MKLSEIFLLVRKHLWDGACTRPTDYQQHSTRYICWGLNRLEQTGIISREDRDEAEMIVQCSIANCSLLTAYARYELGVHFPDTEKPLEYWPAAQAARREFLDTLIEHLKQEGL